jgi:hypothetical protein
VARDVKRVLADIDADHGDRGIGCLRHGVLLVFGAPCQLRLLAGQEHGRTIPLADPRGQFTLTSRVNVTSGVLRASKNHVDILPLPLTSISPRASSTNSPRKRS